MEKNKMDAERAAFEAAFEGVFFSSCFEREDDGSYAGRGLQGAWLGWQKARSLPVGVPSIRDFADEVKQLCKDFSDLQNRPYMGDVTAAIDGLYEQFMQSDAMLAAAPTVKAEQECRCTMRQRLAGDGCSVCNPEYAADHEAEPAPSLPAAGSAVEEVEVVGYRWKSSIHTAPDLTPYAPASTFAPGYDYVDPLMTVAQHERIVATLSAQQSAPERVSVPVERIQIALEAVQNAMEDAYNNAYQNCCGRGNGQCCGDPEPAWSDADQAIMDALAPAQRELSALLASHGRGEA